MTFRTTLRETRKSRQIALIVIFREKYARRLSSPQSASRTRPPKRSGGLSGPLSPGSRLDADPPENGVLIPCRMTSASPTRKRLEASDGMIGDRAKRKDSRRPQGRRRDLH